MKIYLIFYKLMINLIKPMKQGNLIKKFIKQVKFGLHMTFGGVFRVHTSDRPDVP